MLDLGGGRILYSHNILAAHPTLKAVIYDQPPVAAVAREFISKYGMQDRVETIGGNYLESDIGSGYDLIWASMTLYFAKERLDELVTRIYQSLNSGGCFISLHEGFVAGETQADIVLAWLGNLLTTGEDRRMMRGEISASMLRCGFRSVHSRTIQTPTGEMELDIARK
jgi:hypothetical protein